jgi:hypothetical protein
MCRDRGYLESIISRRGFLRGLYLGDRHYKINGFNNTQLIMIIGKSFVLKEVSHINIINMNIIYNDFL